MAPDTWLQGLTPRLGVAIVWAVATVTMAWWSLHAPSQAMDWRGHVEDLRRRLLISVVAVGTVSVALFSFGWPKDSAWPRPAIHDNIAGQAFHRIAADLVPAGVELVVVRPIDGFLAEVTIAIGLAVLLTSPLLVAQVGGFVLPALQERERRALRNAVLPVALLFIAGAAFAYAYVMPFLLKTLYGYGTALGATPLLQVSELITMTVGLMAIMGLAFQTPVVMVVATRIGLVDAKTWRHGWRHATVAILILSALVTDPTIVSQLMVAGPLLALYAAGAIMAGFTTVSRSSPA